MRVPEPQSLKLAGTSSGVTCSRLLRAMSGAFSIFKNGNYIPVFDHPHSYFFSLWLNGMSFFFWFVHTVSSPFTRCYWEESESIFFILSHWVFMHIYKTPPKHSLGRMVPAFSASLWKVLQSLHHICGLTLDSLQDVHGGVDLDPTSACPSTSAEHRGKITSLDLLAMLFLMQHRILLAFFSTRTHCWRMINLLSTTTSAPFLIRYSPAVQLPVCGPFVWWTHVCPVCT